MPIVYVHGVANREQRGYQEGFASITTYLRRYVAEAISDDPDGVRIVDGFWGDLGATFAWDGASRPASPLLGMGPETVPDVQRINTYAEFRDPLRPISAGLSTSAPSTGGLIAAGADQGGAGQRLSDLPPEALSDLMAALLTSMAREGDDLEAAIIAADELAWDPAFRAELAALSPEAEHERFAAAVEARTSAADGLLGQGAPWLARLGDRVTEALDYGAKAPGWAASRVLMEARKPLNALATLFIGDVFAFLDDRQGRSRKAAILDRVLSRLREAKEDSEARGGEPIVVLSHSMGGQIVYEMVSHVLPNGTATDRGIHVDFWCATASQVGLFEELKLFSASRPEHSKQSNTKVPFPAANLGAWWNVWDSNDVLSFTVKQIFDGVDDEEFDGGLSIVSAHGGYLARPTFYRKLAKKIGGALGGR